MIIFIKVVVHIMFVVVVSAIMAFIVVSLLFLCFMTLDHPTGTLVLLYHLNLYIIIFIKVVEFVILFVVVPRLMNSFVVSLVFFSVLHFLGTAGTVVQPYHLNQYFFCNNFVTFCNLL